MEEVCPDALFLNYTNPMAMLTGYMQRYTGVKTVGLCHSVQVCSETLLKELGMEDKLHGRKELIAGINHMGWLLKIMDREGKDLYPEIKERADAKLADPEMQGQGAPGVHQALRLLLHRVQRAQRGVQHVLHQEQVPRAHRALQHPPG